MPELPEVEIVRKSLDKKIRKPIFKGLSKRAHYDLLKVDYPNINQIKIISDT